MNETKFGSEKVSKLNKESASFRNIRYQESINNSNSSNNNYNYSPNNNENIHKSPKTDNKNKLTNPVMSMINRMSNASNSTEKVNAKFSLSDHKSNSK